MSNALRASEEWLADYQRKHGVASLAPANDPPKQVAKPKANIPKPDGDVDLLCWQLDNVGLPHEREHRFHDRRKWRFDIAFPAVKLAIEIDGGLFIDGGHSRGRARINDMERDIAANLLGWLVVRMPPEWIKPGTALAHIEQLVKVRA